MKNNPHTDQPNPPDVGTSNDEGGASPHSNGAATVPAAPPISDGRATLPRSPDQNVPSCSNIDTDRRAQFEALRRLVQRQLLENQQLLKSILEVEQASDWASHPAALNALSQITSDTKDFYAWLMQTSLKATHATANKK